MRRHVMIFCSKKDGGILPAIQKNLFLYPFFWPSLEDDADLRCHHKNSFFLLFFLMLVLLFLILGVFAVIEVTIWLE